MPLFSLVVHIITTAGPHSVDGPSNVAFLYACWDCCLNSPYAMGGIHLGINCPVKMAARITAEMVYTSEIARNVWEYLVLAASEWEVENIRFARFPPDERRVRFAKPLSHPLAIGINDEIGVAQVGNFNGNTPVLTQLELMAMWAI